MNIYTYSHAKPPHSFRFLHAHVLILCARQPTVLAASLMDAYVATNAPSGVNWRTAWRRLPGCKPVSCACCEFWLCVSHSKLDAAAFFLFPGRAGRTSS